MNDAEKTAQLNEGIIRALLHALENIKERLDALDLDIEKIKEKINKINLKVSQ